MQLETINQDRPIIDDNEREIYRLKNRVNDLIREINFKDWEIKQKGKKINSLSARIDIMQECL